MGAVSDGMIAKLQEAFSPEVLNLVDESEKHRGHAGHREGGESHFRLEIVSGAFDGKSRLERQRAVMDVLADELAGAVHALTIRARAPGEGG